MVFAGWQGQSLVCEIIIFSFDAVSLHSGVAYCEARSPYSQAQLWISLCNYSSRDDTLYEGRIDEVRMGQCF